MGAVCSGGIFDEDCDNRVSKLGFSGKLKTAKSFKQNKEDSEAYDDVFEKNSCTYDSGESRVPFSSELKPSTPARTCKTHQASTFLGRAKVASVETAVGVLDTLGSSITTLHAGSGFVSGIGSKGNDISILAFEVANTIVKGVNLLQSLSEENIQFLKAEILESEGVRKLVSTDMNVLLSIAAADKREELDIFSREVIRFGDLCKDPQLHNLGRYFSNLEVDPETHIQLRQDAEDAMHELTTLAQNTSELYHEVQALDRFEQDLRQKLDEVESLNLPRKGESLMILQSELKHQKKLVKSLKKKSLWSKHMEEIMEKLVDIVSFIHQEIKEIFGYDGVTIVGQDPDSHHKRLGAGGLALHYANIITQIDNVASRPASLPANIRDTLYHGLPINVKIALRSQLQTADTKKQLSIPQIKAEMEKTLQWLVPVATNTTKSHQGFGWVGEWANTGTECGKKTTNNVVRLQTLYHADKEKTEQYILELVKLLHYLVSQVRHKDSGFKPQPIRSTHKAVFLHFDMQKMPSSKQSNNKTHMVKLSQEDSDLLEAVSRRGLMMRGISKSQEFAIEREPKIWALARSADNSPSRNFVTRTNSLDVTF